MVVRMVVVRVVIMYEIMVVGVVVWRVTLLILESLSRLKMNSSSKLWLAIGNMSLFLSWWTNLKYIYPVSDYLHLNVFRGVLVRAPPGDKRDCCGVDRGKNWTPKCKSVRQSYCKPASHIRHFFILNFSNSRYISKYQNLFLRYQPKHDFAIENGLKCFLRCYSSYQNVSLGSCITLNWWVDGTQQQGYTALQLQFLSLNQFWT